MWGSCNTGSKDCGGECRRTMSSAWGSVDLASMLVGQLLTRGTQTMSVTQPRCQRRAMERTRGRGLLSTLSEFNTLATFAQPVCSIRSPNPCAQASSKLVQITHSS
ncbi:hypothetical protein V6N13_055035 [Hibiscus sabdariffa]|uniref:Uncharacterized protein n=1 Tax=Hibiscus sabdariffa TaxID=183260 RepID=A0ABR2A317_9ROSI